MRQSGYCYLVTLDRFDRMTSLDDPVNSATFSATYRADGQAATLAAPNGNTTTHGTTRSVGRARRPRPGPASPGQPMPGPARLRMVTRAGTTIRFRYVGLTTSQAQVVDHGTSAVIRHLGTDWTGTGSDLRHYGTNGHHDVTWTAGASGARHRDPALLGHRRDHLGHRHRFGHVKPPGGQERADDLAGGDAKPGQGGGQRVTRSRAATHR
jgi:hypothetical protein